MALFLFPFVVWQTNSKYKPVVPVPGVFLSTFNQCLPSVSYVPPPFNFFSQIKGKNSNKLGKKASIWHCYF